MRKMQQAAVMGEGRRLKMMVPNRVICQHGPKIPSFENLRAQGILGAAGKAGAQKQLAWILDSMERSALLKTAYLLSGPAHQKMGRTST